MPHWSRWILRKAPNCNGGMGCSKRVIRRLSFRILPVARSYSTLPCCKQQSMNCHKYTGCGGNLQVYAHFCRCVSATLMHSSRGDEQAEEYERSLLDERKRIEKRCCPLDAANRERV